MRDDADGLVTWLAPGSQRMLQVLQAGGPPRRDGAEDMASERIITTATWNGPGILCISPTGTPWSVWLFWDKTGSFSGWYANLESPHLRNTRGTCTEDHILDVTITSDGHATLKDSDDLNSAVCAGHVNADDAALIRQHADLVRESFRRRDWPFDEHWTHFQPPVMWTALTLDDAPAW